MEIKEFTKAIWCQRERWHHWPYVTHIATLQPAGQALLMTSQSTLRTEYLVLTDDSASLILW